jgi:hypothetical protein
MAIDDLRYYRVMQGLRTLMLTDAKLGPSGTYGVKQISAGEPLVEGKYPAIQIFITQDEPNPDVPFSFELGGSSGNIYHRILRAKVIVYQAWEGAAEEEIFAGKTLNSGVKYGIYQMSCYLKGFLTDKYTIDGEVFLSQWSGTNFNSGGEEYLPHGELSANIFYNEQI